MLCLDEAEDAVDGGVEVVVVVVVVVGESDGEVWREECGKWFWP